MEPTAKPSYELLFDFILRIKHEWGVIAEHHDLSLAQLHAMWLLAQGAVPMVQLSAFLTCDASYVTGIVDRLEQQGLVERQENPHDRRVKFISLTRKGKKMYDNMQRSMSNMQAKVLSCLSLSEQHEFNRLLVKISQHAADTQNRNP
jgi:DNA-binding MarR family transcriptional regulator